MAISVGLIGYGLSGSVFHAPVIDRVEGLSLQAVVSSDPAKVRKDFPAVDVVADVEALLARDEIEVVVVTSPNATHYDYAKRAIAAGKHVVVEKPFTLTTAEAEELIALAEQRGVLLTVYHNRRWDGDFLTVRRLLESGALGRLSTFESRFDRYRPEVRNRWREQDLPGSGLLYDLGPHLIDQALLLFGMPKTVWADLRLERPGARAVDYFHLVLGYDEVRAILHAGSLAREPGPRFVLHGDKGTFVKYGLDPQEGQLRQGLRPGDPGWGEDSADRYGQLVTEVGGLVIRGTVETAPGAYEQFYRELAEAVRKGGPAPVSALAARDTMLVIECALKSHREQRVVSVR